MQASSPCSFHPADLKNAAQQATQTTLETLVLPDSPGLPKRVLPKSRVTFQSTTTVLLFSRILDGGKIPSDAEAPLGMGELLMTLTLPLSNPLTENPRCPHTGRRPGCMPVPPEERLALLRGVDTAVEAIADVVGENVRFLQELSDSREAVWRQRALLKRARDEDLIEMSRAEALARCKKRRTIAAATAGGAVVKEASAAASSSSAAAPCRVELTA